METETETVAACVIPQQGKELTQSSHTLTIAQYTFGVHAKQSHASSNGYTIST